MFFNYYHNFTKTINRNEYEESIFVFHNSNASPTIVGRSNCGIITKGAKNNIALNRHENCFKIHIGNMFPVVGIAQNL